MFTAVLIFSACHGGEDAVDRVSIALGDHHSCAVTASGGLACWGKNGEGVVGDGTTANATTPIGVVGLSSGVVEVAAGAHHTCAVTSAGGVKCWGTGLLGDGPPSLSTTPVDVVGLTSDAAAVAVGRWHSCALTTAGGVKCWGANSTGALGVARGEECLFPNDDVPLPCNSSASDVVGLESGVVSVAAGAFHTCVLTEEGGVKCWGADNFGQLGSGEHVGSLSPLDVAGLESGVATVHAGDYFNCALTTVGGVRCWGANDFGQLGNGTTTESPIPVDVAGLETGVTSVGVGANHACAVSEQGGVMCWGEDRHGAIGGVSTEVCPGRRGVGEAPCSTLPVNVSGLTVPVRAVAPGRYHTCVETTVGDIMCWGANTSGQVGDGTTTDSDTPVEVVQLDGA